MTIHNSELKDLLNDLTTPERAGMLGEIADFLTTLGTAKHELAIESVMSRYDDENFSQSIADIETSLRSSLDDILCEHGVMVSDTDLFAMFRVVEALFAIPNYGDPRALLDIIEDDTQTPEAMLSDIVTYFTDMDGDNILATIAEVKQALIEKIRSVLQDNLNVETDTIEDIARKTMIRNRFKMHFADGLADTTLVKLLINDGYGIALEPDTYIEACHDQLKTMGSLEVVKQLSAIVLLSDVDDTDLLTTVQTHLPTYVSDITPEVNAAISHYFH